MCLAPPIQPSGAPLLFEIGGPGAARMVPDPYSGNETWHRSDEAQTIHSCARAKAKKPVSEKLGK